MFKPGPSCARNQSCTEDQDRPRSKPSRNFAGAVATRRSDRPAKTATQTSEIGGYGEVWPGASALTHAAGHTGPRRVGGKLAEAHTTYSAQTCGSVTPITELRVSPTSRPIFRSAMPASAMTAPSLAATFAGISAEASISARTIRRSTRQVPCMMATHFAIALPSSTAMSARSKCSVAPTPRRGKFLVTSTRTHAIWHAD